LRERNTCWYSKQHVSLYKAVKFSTLFSSLITSLLSIDLIGNICQSLTVLMLYIQVWLFYAYFYVYLHQFKAINVPTSATQAFLKGYTMRTARTAAGTNSLTYLPKYVRAQDNNIFGHPSYNQPWRIWRGHWAPYYGMF
jgi:hypothetical protein